MIHYALEGHWGIALAKQHNHGFEESKRCLERSFPLIPISDVDIMVSPSNVKFSEEAFSGEILCKQGDV